MKYKVGDKVRIKPKFHFCSVDGFNNINMKDEFFNEYSRLPYCETVMTIGIVNKDFYILKEDRWAYKWTDEMIEGLVEEEETKNWTDISIPDGPFTVTYGSPSMNDSMNKNNIDNGIIILPEGYIFKDENGNEILTSKIILEKKKKEYPKTYEECCEIFQYNKNLKVYPPFNADIPNYDALHLFDLLEALRKLLICRDAYWKIAGEEMGLGKPWELSIGIPIYYIYYNRTLGTIKKNYADDIQGNVILAFPTEEMRDAFKENFDTDIEICKEFL